MARTISINIPHTLGKDEARRQIAAGFSNIERNLAGGMLGLVSFQNQWDGDVLRFEGGGLGQKTCGRLHVLPASVQIDIDLPDFLAAIAEQIKTKIAKQTQVLLEKKA